MQTRIIDLSQGDLIVHPGRPEEDPVSAWTVRVGIVEPTVAGQPNQWTVWYAELDSGVARFGLDLHADDTVEVLS
jgi:hypothetical protein